MNHLTPEQAIADVKAVRRDHSANHWFACACVLADAFDELRTERDSARRDAANVAGPLLDRISKLYAELDAVKTQRDDFNVAIEKMREAWRTSIQERANLRAELDAIKTEPDANPAPALSRFLPSRPALAEVAT